MTRLLSTLALALALVTVGCGSPQQQANVSQTTMLQFGTVLHEADTVVAHIVAGERDGIVEAVRARSSECAGAVDLDACLTDLVLEVTARTETLVLHLEAVYAALRAWERANDAWRNDGSQPTDWNAAICLPLSDAVDALLIALRARDVEVPETWTAILSQADLVCSMGVSALGGE